MKLTTALTTALILGTICLGTGLAASTAAQPAAETPSSPKVDTNGNGSFTCAQMNSNRFINRMNPGAGRCMAQNYRMQNNQAMMGRGQKGYGQRMAVRQGCGRQPAQGCRVNNRPGIGRGPQQMGPAMTGRMGAGYLTMDPETRKRHDDFRAATTELRRAMAAKRAEKQAVMRSANPDPALAAQLTRDLFDLRTQLQMQARDAGITLAQGGPAVYGRTMRGHGGYGARW